MGDFPDLADKHVIVTGGTGALGRAVSSQLVESGAICHIPCFDENELEGFELAGHPNVRLETDADMSQEASVESFFQRVTPLWASIHCAGGFAMASIEETSLRDLEEQLRLNVRTCFLCCREGVKRIRDNDLGGGRIVNVAARPALEPRQGSGMTVYTASKAAVAAFTQALAEEVASENIWVNAIAPSIMDTPANRAAMPNADFDAWPDVEEVAEAILFLVSPANRVTRGAIVSVYGRS